MAQYRMERSVPDEFDNDKFIVSKLQICQSVNMTLNLKLLMLKVEAKIHKRISLNLKL